MLFGRWLISIVLNSGCMLELIQKWVCQEFPVGKRAVKRLLGKFHPSWKPEASSRLTKDGMVRSLTAILSPEGSALNTELNLLRTAVPGQREPGCFVTLLSTKLTTPRPTPSPDMLIGAVTDLSKWRYSSGSWKQASGESTTVDIDVEVLKIEP